ncbi:leucine-rich repeat-containing protein 36 isoform X3 [Natator depressus]|uniref:leucine-rich repeat-containing protein 36 isoform X3 n=1 Tax=Natator depressus TaxID=27790 RepID=UPI003EBCC118
MLHFGLKRKEDFLFSEKESVSCRENTVKNYAVDKGTSSVSSLDIDSSRNQTESSQKQLTHKLLLKCEAKDSSINTSSASAVQASSSARENKQCSNTLGTQLEEVAGKQLLNHSHLEDEYRSLPSPPQMRSSLRSPDKIRAGLTRGGFRVTFSENDSLDSSLEKDVIEKPNIYYLNQDISSTKKLHLSDTNKTNPYKSHRDTGLDSYDHLYLSSTPQNKDFKRLQKDKGSTNFRDYSVSPANEIKTTSQSTNSDLLTQHTEMDNSTRSLLKLNSDLNTNTHLTSEPALLATRFSTLSTSFSDLTSRHQPLSAEALLEQSQPATMRKTFPSAMPRKDSESAANRCLSPSRMGYKQSDRLHSSLSPQHCFKESNKESVPSDLSNDTSFTESPSPKRTEKASHIAVVLQQLLELVDRYWDGAGSLLLNKNFLAPAQDLLLYLMASTPPQKDVHLPGGDSPSVLAGNAPRLQRTQLKYAEPFDRANMALQQQAKGQEESHVSSSQLQAVDYTAASNYCFSGTHSLTYAAAIAAFRVSPSTPVERLSQIRRKKKRTQEDTFNEILQASVALDNEHRAWRMNSLEKDRVERRKAQEKEREMHQHILGLLRQQQRHYRLWWTCRFNNPMLTSLCSQLKPPYTSVVLSGVIYDDECQPQGRLSKEGKISQNWGHVLKLDFTNPVTNMNSWTTVAALPWSHSQSTWALQSILSSRQAGLGDKWLLTPKITKYSHCSQSQETNHLPQASLYLRSHTKDNAGSQ